MSCPAWVRVHMPISSASSAKSVRNDVETHQPTIRRENTSNTHAAYTQPVKKRVSIMPATQSRLGFQGGERPLDKIRARIATLAAANGA